MFIVAFGLSLSYCGVWFVFGVIFFYHFGLSSVWGDSDKQNGFDQSLY